MIEKIEVIKTKYRVFKEYSTKRFSHKYLKESPLSWNILKKIIKIGNNRRVPNNRLVKIHLLFSILKNSVLFPASFIKN